MNKLFSYLVICVSLFIGASVKAQADVVSVSGRKIMVNNSEYIIKGICYNPVPKGSEQRSWTTLTGDLALMTEAGINTIRVYSPIDDEDVLDEIAAAGIKIVMGFGYNMNGYYDILSGSYLDYIKKYKNHKAILLWEFGNEYNYHPEWFNNDINNWYTALDDAALEAYYEDPNHPAATAHGELPDANALTRCTNVLVWGLNVYRWDAPASIFNEWESLSSLPMYLSEAGGDRYMTATMNGYDEGENEQAQADATKNILNDVFDHQDVCSGVTLFEFSDEWWKAGNPSSHDKGGWAPNSGGVPYDGAPNEEYWGIVDIDRNKMAAFEEVKIKYNSIIVSNKNAQEQMLNAYPNPVEDIINIAIENNNSTISIYSVTGSLLLQADTSKGIQQLDISDFEKGLYLLHVHNTQGQMLTTQIVKE